MTAWTGVVVDLNSINSHYFFTLNYDYAPWDFEAFLEYESGRSVPSDEVIIDSHAYFLNVPEGKIRAVVDTELGDRFTSPFFDVPPGKAIKIKVEPEWRVE
jgi:hypothetical protein